MQIKNNHIQSESGFALVAAMVILMILVAVGIFSLNISNIEMLIAGNDKVIKEDFYNQERCLGRAKVNYRTWLTDAYLTAGAANASFPPPGNDGNGNGFNDDAECVDRNNNLVGTYKVRNIVDAATTINNWSDVADFAMPADHPANRYPQREHIDKPPVGSGFDVKNFEVRLFVITSYSSDNDKNSVVQEGVFKVFNKFE